MVRVRAPAKLNVGLRITGRRPDGYHEIVTNFLPLRLFDELEVERATGLGVELTSDCEGLPTGDDNLAVLAARRAAEALDAAGGLALQLRKRIPVAAGLGGGSSDAAAAILGVEALLGRGLDARRRAALALSLGADVPFFLNPRAMHATGVGEQLTPIPEVPELWWVLALLPFPVSTAAAYRAASSELTLPRDDPSIAALLGPRGVVSSPHNDLERVTARRHPEIPEARRALRDVGARVTGMSGSGPTVFGMFESRAEAERGAEQVRLPPGAKPAVVSSPGSDAGDWGWGVAKW